MITRYEKEKNFVKFYDDKSEKPYVLNLNTMDFIGKSGKALATFPAGFLKYVGTWTNQPIPNYMTMLNYFSRGCWEYDNSDGTVTSKSVNKLKLLTKYFGIVDRLDAIGYSVDDCECRNPTVLDFIDSNFKKFVKARKENEILTISDFYVNYNKMIFMTSLPNDEHLTEQMKDAMYKYKDSFKAENINRIAYYLSHGLWLFFDCEIEDEGYNGRFGYNNKCTERRTMFAKINEYFTLCENCKAEPEKDFFKHYNTLKKIEKMNKKAVDANKLVEIANQYSWLDGFSADGYTVVFPKTRQDFVIEANNQNNCVYSYYLDKVLRGETIVVFIRKNDAIEKSYITCEINKNLNIVQYLRANNQNCQENADINFKITLSNYLHSYK